MTATFTDQVTVAGNPDSTTRQMTACLGRYQYFEGTGLLVCIAIEDEDRFAGICLDREEAAQLFETLAEFIGAIDAQS